ncbi:MAG: hypothetical protein HY775_02850 [Acidobacteria bacterium]|nr:hypothetical protein [Acidobacteriota bacterium]
MARCPGCGTALGPDDFSEILQLFTCPSCGQQLDEEEAREDEKDGSEA